MDTSRETKRYGDLPDEELLGAMEAKRVELDLLISKLQAQRPSLLPFALLVGSFMLVVGSLVLVVAPLPNQLPRYLSTVASFAAVAFSFATYAAYRSFSAETERGRFVSASLREARDLAAMAYTAISDMRAELGSGELGEPQGKP